jgi:hypothetical protein
MQNSMSFYPLRHGLKVRKLAGGQAHVDTAQELQQRSCLINFFLPMEQPMEREILFLGLDPPASFASFHVTAAQTVQVYVPVPQLL